MPSDDRICKTAQQFSRYPLPEEDMAKLREIAADECTVRNYVYQRYGGVKSIRKLYSAYAVQNEMTACGLRERLGLPSPFYYSAVNDALADIKTQWTRLIAAINENVRRHPDFTDADRHYIRFMLKFESCYACIFNGQEPVIADRLKGKLEDICSRVDCGKLNSYMRRQARRHIKKLHSDNISGFSVTERGYRYGDHGIYISTKVFRRRIFVELTDTVQYRSRLYIALDNKKRGINIKAPVYVHIRRHEDYTNQVGLALGISHMLTTDSGRIYGGDYGVYHGQMVAYVRERGGANRRESGNNPGREKYRAGKKRLEDGLHIYINRELNRFLAEEKPRIVYLPGLPQNPTPGKIKKCNQSLTMWQRGYITERLKLKCAENSIRFVEVTGKNIGSICSACQGSDYSLENGNYICRRCGLRIDSRRNAAANALRRGEKNEGHTDAITDE